MAKATNKTKPETVKPTVFLKTVEPTQRREDGEVLLEFFSRITGLKPTMWGPSIIGYGRYHYVYESGREGDMLMTGFSPRKAKLVIYVMPGYQDLGDKLDRLGKHKLGKSCLYINKLSNVDMDVLEEIVRFGIDYVKEKYETFDA